MSGIKGKSGRKGVLSEFNHYKFLMETFFGKVNIEKLKKKIESGKYSAQDRFQYEVLAGSKEERIALFKKLVPDSVIQDIQTRTEFEGIKIDK